MLCPFSAQGLPIPLQNNVNAVVLMQEIIPDIVPLCRNEILGPADGWHEVANVHDFCLYGTFPVYLLFCGANDREYKPQK